MLSKGVRRPAQRRAGRIRSGRSGRAVSGGRSDPQPGVCRRPSSGSPSRDPAALARVFFPYFLETCGRTPRGPSKHAHSWALCRRAARAAGGAGRDAEPVLSPRGALSLPTPRQPGAGRPPPAARRPRPRPRPAPAPAGGGSDDTRRGGALPPLPPGAPPRPLRSALPAPSPLTSAFCQPVSLSLSPSLLPLAASLAPEHTHLPRPGSAPASLLPPLPPRPGRKAPAAAPAPAPAAGASRLRHRRPPRQDGHRRGRHM